MTRRLPAAHASAPSRGPPERQVQLLSEESRAQDDHPHPEQRRTGHGSRKAQYFPSTTAKATRRTGAKNPPSLWVNRSGSADEPSVLAAHTAGDERGRSDRNRP